MMQTIWSGRIRPHRPPRNGNPKQNRVQRRAILGIFSTSLMTGLWQGCGLKHSVFKVTHLPSQITITADQHISGGEKTGLQRPKGTGWVLFSHGDNYFLPFSAPIHVQNTLKCSCHWLAQGWLASKILKLLDSEHILNRLLMDGCTKEMGLKESRRKGSK